MHANQQAQDAQEAEIRAAMDVGRATNAAYQREAAARMNTGAGSGPADVLAGEPTGGQAAS